MRHVCIVQVEHPLSSCHLARLHPPTASPLPLPCSFLSLRGGEMEKLLNHAGIRYSLDTDVQARLSDQGRLGKQGADWPLGCCAVLRLCCHNC